MPWYEITVYDLLKHGALVMTTGAAEQLARRLMRPALTPYQVGEEEELAAHRAKELGPPLPASACSCTPLPTPARSCAPLPTLARFGSYQRSNLCVPWPLAGSSSTPGACCKAHTAPRSVTPRTGPLSSAAQRHSVHWPLSSAPGALLQGTHSAAQRHSAHWAPQQRRAASLRALGPSAGRRVKGASGICRAWP